MNRKARRAAIIRIIQSRSGDSDLSPIAIAKMLGIASRYVHLLLEETGKSFTHYLLARRLQRQR